MRNYGSVIATFPFRPADYFSNPTPFPAFFSKNDGAGRTLKVYVTWN